MSRPAWLDEPQVQAAVAANAAAAPALTEAQLDLLRRTGFFTPAVASSPATARTRRWAGAGELGAAGPTRSSGLRGSGSPAAAKAGQPSGSHAPARSKSKKKAGAAPTTPARDASTPASGVQETA